MTDGRLTNRSQIKAEEVLTGYRGEKIAMEVIKLKEVVHPPLEVFKMRLDKALSELV